MENNKPKKRKKSLYRTRELHLMLFPAVIFTALFCYLPIGGLIMAFFRVDKSRSRELGGVGLGLAMVREIVRVHDGKIEVRGNEQGGTTFEVRMGME